MKKVYAILLIPVLLAGCKDTVPQVNDATNISVKGKQYKPAEFIREFCQNPENKGDDNCVKVEKQMLSDQTRIINVNPYK
jgi:PBP1b-binding outer membrane lipoprotein LpoB